MKKALVLLVLAMLAVPVLAQQPPAQPKTTLEFDAQQLQWLNQAIMELPKKIADPFFAELSAQITEQQKVAAEKLRAAQESKKAGEAKEKKPEKK